MSNPQPRRRHLISREEAALLLRRRPSKVTGRGGHLPREVIDQVLAQPGCTGLRFYYGTKSDGSMTLVFVGIDEQERDMADGSIVEDAYPCPPFCDATSPLIS